MAGSEPSVEEMRAQLKAAQAAGPSVEEMRAELTKSDGSLIPPTSSTRPLYDPSKAAVPEQHPAVSTSERIWLLNFAKRPEDQVANLKKWHPDLEVVQGPKGILLKAPGDTSFRYLDPPPSLPTSLPKLGEAAVEVARDVGDVGVDVAKGFVTTAAGAGGAILGAGGGLPGAVAGMTAAGAASNTAADELQSAIGRSGLGTSEGFGRPIDMAPPTTEERLTSAGTGAVLAPIGGIGGIGKGPVNALVAKGLTKAQAQTLESGLLGMGLKGGAGALRGTRDKFTPAVGEMFSGVPRQALKTARDQPELIQQLGRGTTKEATGEELNAYLKSLKTETEARLGAKQEEISSNLIDLYKSVPEPVSLEPAKAVLDGRISELEARLAKNPDYGGLKEQISSMRELRDKYFTPREPVVVPDTDTGLLDASGRPIIRPGSVTVQKPVTKVPASEAWNFARELENAGKIYNTPGTTLKNMSSASATPAAVREDAALRKAGQEIREALSTATGGEAKKLNTQYSELMAARDRVADYFGDDPQKTFNKLSNVPNAGKTSTAGTLSHIDKQYGTQLVPAANVLQAVKFMGNPSLLPVSGGTTSTTRTALGGGLGGAVGHFVGKEIGGPEGANMGRQVGFFMGTASGGPKAQELYGRVGNAIFNPVEDMLRRNYSPYLQMGTAPVVERNSK